MLKNKTEITIVKGKKAWYALLFPFACFCVAIGVLWNGFEVLTSGKDISFIEVVLGWSFVASLFVILGAVFGMVRDYHFDFSNKRYKIVKRVGIIGFGRWRKLQNLEYVSVFENLDNRFEINLWYNANKHFFIDTYFSSKTAINHAVQLAKQLEIELHNGITNQQIIIENNMEAPVPKEQRKIDAYFSHGNRPFWHTVVAAFCFTVSFVFIYGMFFEISINQQSYTFPIRSIEIVLFLMVTGIRFSMVNDYVFDLENNQFKVIHVIGFVKWGKWKQLSTLDYISVFQKKEGEFEINLWYNTNKHILLSGSNDYNAAIETGKKLAKKLDIELLDASNPHDKEWVELS